jgi:hypothetical protein
MQVIRFGKYKGQPVARLADDPDYVSWLLAQEWLEECHPDVYAYVRGLEVPALEYCTALNRDGTACQFWAKYGDVCKRHFHRDSAGDFSAWESELVPALSPPARVVRGLPGVRPDILAK